MKRKKDHPLTKSWFLARALFLWCNDSVNTSKATPWTQEMNYELTEFDRISSHKDRLTHNYRKYNKLLIAILMTYKKETLILVISQMILSFFKNFAIKVVSDSFESISVLPLYKNPKNLKTVAFKLLGGSLLVSLAYIADQNFEFATRRISLAVRSSLFSIMQDKIMRYSTLNSEEISQGFIADLIQVDIVFLNEMYYIIYSIFGASVGFITSLGFMVYFLGVSQTFIFIPSFGLLLGIYHLNFALQAYIRKHYLQAKDKRMSLLRDILENIDHVKINGLENYFCLEMYEKREGEI